MPYGFVKAARSSRPALAEMPVREVRGCDWPGCWAEGAYRAPRDRDRLTEYFWFCLDHVRDYNSSWNYYRGMSENEIEADIRADTVWRRPSWPFIKALHTASFRQSAMFDDLAGGREPPRPAAEGGVGPAQARALVVLELIPPVTIAVVKARYKELVKKHHPDANNGDKAAEERFKQISEAYRLVMDALEP
jgi:hypothetical protein